MRITEIGTGISLSKNRFSFEMSNCPLVSVLMTCFNRERYISEAIESVLNSSYKNFELIIVDDCSNDATFEIARSYLNKDTRVRLYINERNLGDYPNRNKAAEYAKGKYIKYLDSDDKIYPWGLQAMVDCMEKCPEAGFGLMSIGLAQKKSYPIIVNPKDAYRAFFYKSALLHMGPSGAIIKRSVFQEMGGYSGLQFVGDTEMWLTILRKYSVVRMPSDLIWWREHEGQQIIEEGRDINILKSRFEMMRRSLIHPDCPLDNKESLIVLQNLKNLQVRRIIRENLFRLQFVKSFKLFKENGLKLADIIKSLKKNKTQNI